MPFYDVRYWLEHSKNPLLDRVMIHRVECQAAFNALASFRRNFGDNVEVVDVRELVPVDKSPKRSGDW